MRALFECRLEHIGGFDRVKVECACGRMALLSLDAFNGLPRNPRIIDLKRHLRCDGCGQKGHVDISIVWADYSSRRVAAPARSRRNERRSRRIATRLE